MKAIVQDRYGSPDVLELRDIDVPEPGPDEVLIRVRGAGIDPGVWHLMAGLPYMIRLNYGLRSPKKRVPGVDVSGSVEAVGSNVTRFRPGDAVFGTCEGALAGYACASEKKLALKPENLSYEEAAAVPISACTALHALRDKGNVQAGQKVLITGAGGGVGTFAVQLAAAWGAEVTGVCSTSRVDLVRSLGAAAVIDRTSTDFTTNGGRYDLIIDTAGNRRLSDLRRALTERGTLVIVGGEGGGRWLGGFDRSFRAPVVSLFVRQNLRMLISAETHEDLALLKEMLESGSISPVVDKTFPLSGAPEAIHYVHGGRALGKVVVTVGGDDGAST